MKFLTGYEPDKELEAHSLRAGFKCVGDSLTVQADARDADINVIMERYARTGQVPPLPRLPSYGDFDGIADYRTAIHAVREAEDLFMRLPAKVRSRFDNDPAQFVDFCSSDANREELADLGLLNQQATDEIKKKQLERRQAEAAADSAPAAVRDRSRRPVDKKNEPDGEV